MDETERRKRRLTLAACCGVHAVQDGLSAAFLVVLPTLAEAFGLTYAQVGVMRAVKTCAMALFEIPSGVLAERFGERVLLVFGLISAGCGYIALAVAPGIAAITASLFVIGFGGAFQHALSSSIISNTIDGARSRTALGTYNSAGDIGKLAFTGAYSLAVGAGLAWKGVVTGFGMTALLAAAALYLVLGHARVGRRPERRVRTSPAGGRGGWGIRDRLGFSTLVAIVFLDIAVQSGYLTFLAFLMLEKQVPAVLATFAVVLTLAGGIFGKFGCGLLAERVGVRPALVTVEILTAAGIVAVLYMPTLAAFLLLPVLGVVLQGSSSITYATVSDLVHADRRPRGFAAIYTVASAASIAGPILFGVIGDRLGLAPAMLAMAAATVLPVPLCILLRPAMADGYAR